MNEHCTYLISFTCECSSCFVNKLISMNGLGAKQIHSNHNHNILSAMACCMQRSKHLKPHSPSFIPWRQTVVPFFGHKIPLLSLNPRWRRARKVKTIKLVCRFIFWDKLALNNEGLGGKRLLFDF